MKKIFRCRSDYLKITNEKKGSFGKYCGEMSGKSVFVPGDQAIITFFSDAYDERRGFRLSFTTGSPGKNILAEDTTDVKIIN